MHRPCHLRLCTDGRKKTENILWWARVRAPCPVRIWNLQISIWAAVLKAVLRSVDHTVLGEFLHVQL